MKKGLPFGQAFIYVYYLYFRHKYLSLPVLQDPVMMAKMVHCIEHDCFNSSATKVENFLAHPKIF